MNTTWRTTTLGEVADVVMGQSPPSSSYNFDGNGLPFYQGVVDFGEKYAATNQYTSQPQKIAESGDVLFSVRAPVGRVNIVRARSSIGRGNAAMRMKNGAQEYLYYLLLANEKNFRKRSSGTVFDSISGAELKQLPVIVPSREDEQRSIAAVLSSLDDKIELLRKQNETLEQIAQAIFDERFTSKTINGELPEGWKIVRLTEVADVAIGRTPPRKEKEWFSMNPAHHKWVSIKDLGNCGVYVDTSSEYLTPEAVQRFRVPLIPKGTVVVSFKLTVGRVAIATEDMYSNEAIAHIKTDKLPVEYTYLYFKNFDYSRLGSTSSIATAVNSESIRGMEILVPNVEALNEFTKNVMPLFQKILLNTQNIRTLAVARDALLPKLVSGELRVSN